MPATGCGLLRWICRLRASLRFFGILTRASSASAAPCAIFLARSKSFIAPSAVESRKYHHTAPVSMIYALHAGLKRVLDEGLENSIETDLAV